MSDQTPDPSEQSEQSEPTEVLETDEVTRATEATEATETIETPAEESTTRRGFAVGLHPVNILHLVFGVAFLGMVMTWALIESGAVETSGLRWLLPIPWVAAGAAGLIATAPRLRGR